MGNTGKRSWTAVAAALGCALLATLVGHRRVIALHTSSPSQTLLPVFALERNKTHLGEGAALSPDGKRLVYIGGDNALYVHSLGSGQSQLVLRKAENGLDVLGNPTFSADGGRLLFSASGGTWYYPSNIYVVKVDGSGLARLLESLPFTPGQNNSENGPYYAQYYYAPQCSPDGTKILIRVADSVQGIDQVGVMGADGSGFQLLSQGTPLYWSTDGQSIFYTKAGAVRQLSLRTQASTTISGLDGRILGKWPDKDWFGVDTGTSINVVSVQASSATTVGAWNVPRVKTSATGELMTLSSFQWSSAGTVLLIYEGDVAERLEVDSGAASAARLSDPAPPASDFVPG